MEGAGEQAQWVRMNTILAEDQVQFPAPILGSLQPPTTQTSGTQTPSAFCRPPHACAPTQCKYKLEILERTLDAP